MPALEHERELENPQIVVQFGRPPNRIDLIANPTSVPFERAWRDRVRESIESGGGRIPVWLLSLRDLRAAKREAGRPKDLDDLEHLPEA